MRFRVIWCSSKPALNGSMPVQLWRFARRSGSCYQLNEQQHCRLLAHVCPNPHVPPFLLVSWGHSDHRKRRKKINPNQTERQEKISRQSTGVVCSIHRGGCSLDWIRRHEIRIRCWWNVWIRFVSGLDLIGFWLDSCGVLRGLFQD